MTGAEYREARDFIDAERDRQLAEVAEFAASPAELSAAVVRIDLEHFDALRRLTIQQEN